MHERGLYLKPTVYVLFLRLLSTLLKKFTISPKHRQLTPDPFSQNPRGRDYNPLSKYLFDSLKAHLTEG